MHARCRGPVCRLRRRWVFCGSRPALILQWSPAAAIRVCSVSGVGLWKFEAEFGDSGKVWG